MWMFVGLTPLHVAVLSHNAVVQELSCQRTPPSGHTVALVQRRKLLGECINTLLLMGASIETKVIIVVLELYFTWHLMYWTVTPAALNRIAKAAARLYTWRLKRQTLNFCVFFWTNPTTTLS